MPKDEGLRPNHGFGEDGTQILFVGPSVMCGKYSKKKQQRACSI